MADILEEIVAHKHIELERMMEIATPMNVYRQVGDILKDSSQPPLPSMREALLKSPTGIIAEFKRKSPSKGWINQEASCTEIPLAYQQNGAAAVSILTDLDYFGGHGEFIRLARKSGVHIPILFKDFIVELYQLYIARLCGASAVLLIASVLSKDDCRWLMDKAHDLGMEVLLEMHHENELDYAELEPDMCGVNNRNLGSFVTDVENSFRLASRLPANACKVSESGISSPATVTALREAGFRGFLMGEHFMMAKDPGMALGKFIEALR